MVDEIKQISLNLFSYVILAEFGFALSWRITTFLLLMNAGIFMQLLQLLRVQVCIECLRFKNSKWIIPWWSNHTYHFSSMKLSLWGRLWRLILINSLPFVLNIFSHLSWLSRETSHFSTWKENLSLWIYDVYSSKTIRKCNAQFVYFSYLFQVTADGEWES